MAVGGGRPVAAKLLDGRSLGQVLMAFVRDGEEGGSDLVAVGCPGSGLGVRSTKRIHSPSSVRGLDTGNPLPLEKWLG